MEEDQGNQNGEFTMEAQEGEEEDTLREQDMSEKSQNGSMSSIQEKQENEQSEGEKGAELASPDSSLVRSDLLEPLLSDEDDHDRLETDKMLRQMDMAQVVSDTEISEIPIQDNASDREILDDEVDIEKDLSDDNIGSVSDDSENTISEDKYMQFPTQTKRNASCETDDIIQGLTEEGTVMRDIFVEPDHMFLESTPVHSSVETDHMFLESSPVHSSDTRFTSTRSRYTRPRMPPPSYSPCIRPPPIGYYLDDDEVHVSIFSSYIITNIGARFYLR